jgi:glycosyltransferase involved in cell wall biosynthesis
LTEERVFVSEGVRSSFSEYFGRKAADQVIHNIFDPAAYRLPCRLSATVGRLKSSGKPVLGVVSRLVEQKGLPELLQIHQELLARGFDHHLVVIGDGPLEAALSEEVSSKRLAPSFHLLGADPSPLAAMRLCDLMLLTSEHEAWPTVILEAFHAHTPIISFACPSGPPELLTGSLQGCLVHQRTAHAFADTVQYAYAHRAELVRAGARRLADFTPEMIIPYWMALLR